MTITVHTKYCLIPITACTKYCLMLITARASLKIKVLQTLLNSWLLGAINEINKKQKF